MMTWLLKRTRWILLTSISALGIHCGAPSAEFVNEPADQTEASLTGVDDAADQADTTCTVVLRSMRRVADQTGGYETRDGSWVWRANVDVAETAVAEGLEPILFYQNRGDRIWRTLGAVRGGTEGGFTQFTVDVWEGMPSSGMSGTALRNTRVLVIPYLALSAGGRLFDHNRIRDRLGTYEISGESGLAINPDETICPYRAPVGAATLRFSAESIEQVGLLEPGGTLTVDYDLSRLTACRGTHNGYPAWDIIAHARFLPGGQSAQASVRFFGAPNGTPSLEPESMPFTTRIPADTSRVELWFENYTGAGSNCRAWDSNYGSNFQFPVLTPVGWMGKPVVAISRGGATACSGVAMDEGFVYDTWTRQRAAYRNVCFEIWKRDVTDRDNPELWREINAQVHFRYAPTEAFQTAYLNFARRDGNNAQYVFALDTVDPFRPYRCTTEPYVVTPAGYDVATMEFYFSANGATLRRPDGTNFVGRFEDDPGSHNCPPPN
ncbi:MAG: hypothetical protein H6729_02175 [Deltaproteobacteria bacterium]|nr:hypothetical protein [Deltaproteobacteria bacterium]